MLRLEKAHHINNVENGSYLCEILSLTEKKGGLCQISEDNRREKQLAMTY